MLRQIPIALAMAWLASAANAPDAAAPSEPPSSLDPSASRGKLTLRHTHVRVRACERKTIRGKLSCTPEHESADARAQLKLSPVRATRIAEEDKRQARDISLGADGTADEIIELGAGAWELDWTDAARRTAFRIAGGDELSIRLESSSGSCRLVQRECNLVASATTRKIVLPADRAR